MEAGASLWLVAHALRVEMVINVARPALLPAAMKTAVEIPLGSRHVRLTAKGPDLLSESTA